MSMKKIILLIVAGFWSLSSISCDKENPDQSIDNNAGDNMSFDFRKPNLKVLDIGNSYTVDATALLPLITKASGSDVSDMCLYKATRGSASFKLWYDIYNGEDSPSASYEVSKVLGGLDANVRTGSSMGDDRKLFRECLTNEKWDLIIIHQVSNFAPYYEQWQEENSAGYLNEFIRILKKHQPQAKIGFLLVHSYMDNYSVNSEKSSLARWQKIADSVKKLEEDYDIELVIPYGTAVENLRASSLNNEYDLTSDGTHCGYGLCRYTAACCYYQALIAPRSGISVLGNSARYTVPENEKNSKYPAYDVTDENAEIAQKAAFIATYQWDKCVNPETEKPI